MATSNYTPSAKHEWGPFCIPHPARESWGHGGRPWPGPDPKGGGGGGHPPPPLRTPKLSHGTVCFVGAGGAADFVLGIRRGGIFLFDPMCLYSKYSEFCGEFKNG